MEPTQKAAIEAADLFVVHDGLQVVRLTERVDLVRRLLGEVFQPTAKDVLRPNLDILITVRPIVTHAYA